MTKPAVLAKEFLDSDDMRLELTMKEAGEEIDFDLQWVGDQASNTQLRKYFESASRLKGCMMISDGLGHEVQEKILKQKAQNYMTSAISTQ